MFADVQAVLTDTEQCSVVRAWFVAPPTRFRRAASGPELRERMVDAATLALHLDRAADPAGKKRRVPGSASATIGATTAFHAESQQQQQQQAATVCRLRAFFVAAATDPLVLRVRTVRSTGPRRRYVLGLFGPGSAAQTFQLHSPVCDATCQRIVRTGVAAAPDGGGSMWIVAAPDVVAAFEAAVPRTLVLAACARALVLPYTHPRLRHRLATCQHIVRAAADGIPEPARSAALAACRVVPSMTQSCFL